MTMNPIPPGAIPPYPDDLRDRARGDYVGRVDDPGTASWILGGILAAAVIIGLFFVGERPSTTELPAKQTTENVVPMPPVPVDPTPPRPTAN